MKATYVVEIKNVAPENEGATCAAITAAVFAKARKVVDRTHYDRVERYDPPSIGERIEAAVEKLDDAASTVEDLASEMQDWYDNLPEAFQNGEKGDALQEAQSALEELHGELTSFDFEPRFGGPKGARVLTHPGLSDRVWDLFPNAPDAERTVVVDLTLRLSPYVLENYGLRVDRKSLAKAIASIPGATSRKLDGGGSRADRLAEAGELVAEVVEIFRETVEAIRATLPTAPETSDSPTIPVDSTPAEDLIDELEEAIATLDGLDFSSVEFPGMY